MQGVCKALACHMWYEAISPELNSLKCRLKCRLSFRKPGKRKNLPSTDLSCLVETSNRLRKNYGSKLAGINLYETLVGNVLVLKRTGVVVMFQTVYSARLQFLLKTDGVYCLKC